MSMQTGSVDADGLARTTDGKLYVTLGSGSGVTLASPTFTGTVTESGATVVSHQTTGVVRQLARWGVPVALASSGSMGNNGAVSAMTALPATYSGGIWLYYPAGAVAAGVPAAPAFLWTVMTNTTAGTVYNSTWDGLGVPPLGTQTAYSTTGPGAFTGVATGEILAATVTIPAGAIGPNGFVYIEAEATNNTAAGNKTIRIDLGGTDLFQVVLSTAGGGPLTAHIRNKGLATRQHGTGVIAVGTSVLTAGLAYSSIDTANAASLTFTLEKATATNHVIWEGVTVNLVYGA